MHRYYTVCQCILLRERKSKNQSFFSLFLFTYIPNTGHHKIREKHQTEMSVWPKGGRLFHKKNFLKKKSFILIGCLSCLGGKMALRKKRKKKTEEHLLQSRKRGRKRGGGGEYHSIYVMCMNGKRQVRVCDRIRRWGNRACLHVCAWCMGDLCALLWKWKDFYSPCSHVFTLHSKMQYE